MYQACHDGKIHGMDHCKCIPTLVYCYRRLAGDDLLRKRLQVGLSRIYATSIRSAALC